MLTPARPEGSKKAPFRLDERVAVITGATGGIGAATARLLAELGADVVLGHLPDEADAAENLRAELAGQTRCLAIEADMRDADQVDALMAHTVRELDRLDVVVANAGIARRQPAARLSDRDWNAVIDTNLGGVFRCFRAAVPYLGDGGRLLATSSISGFREGWADHAHYTASKAGIAGLVKSIALELAGRSVTVNAVAPGLIRTSQALDPVNSLGPDAVEAAASTIPVGRVGTCEDVAAMFAFLAGAEASFITGQTFIVDGGTSLGGYQ